MFLASVTEARSEAAEKKSLDKNGGHSLILSLNCRNRSKAVKHLLACNACSY